MLSSYPGRLHTLFDLLLCDLQPSCKIRNTLLIALPTGTLQWYVGQAAENTNKATTRKHPGIKYLLQKHVHMLFPAYFYPNFQKHLEGT